MAMRTVDFSRLTSADLQERASTSKALLDSLRFCGFVRLINHRIASSTVSDLFELVSISCWLVESRQAELSRMNDFLSCRSTKKLELEIHQDLTRNEAGAKSVQRTVLLYIVKVC